jgi:hypothetical protein
MSASDKAGHEHLVAIVAEFGRTLDAARDGLRGVNQTLRAGNCRGALVDFVEVAKTVGIAQGVSQFLPPDVQRRALQRANVNKFMDKFAATYDQLERCVIGRPRRIRGFVRSSGFEKARS